MHAYKHVVTQYVCEAPAVHASSLFWLTTGITGWVCDDRPQRGGAELCTLLPTIPEHRLMIETDAPYLIPRTIKPSKSRPHRNEPALLPHVLQQVAKSLNKSEEQVALQTSRVACDFFSLPKGVCYNLSN